MFLGLVGKTESLMAYVVSLKRYAEKELENPRPPGAKTLHGGEGYRVRVGDYRILYMVDDALKRVEIFSLAHRREVYR